MFHIVCIINLQCVGGKEAVGGAGRRPEPHAHWPTHARVQVPVK